MAFCTNCGQELEPGAKFCAECGKATNKINQTNKQRKTVYDGETHKCPNCGEILLSFDWCCSACGYELRGVKIDSLVNELAKKLENANSVEQKSELIRNFYIPNTKEDIYEFIILATSRLSVYDDETNAWESKLEQVYQKAKLVFNDSYELANIQKIYNAAIKKKRTALFESLLKNPKTFKAIVVLMIGLFMMFVGLLFYCISGTAKYELVYMFGCLGVIPFLIGIVTLAIQTLKNEK